MPYKQLGQFILVSLAAGLAASPAGAQTALSWWKQPPPNPAYAHVMATNVGGAGVVTFTRFGRTWVFDGTTWRQRAVASAPLPRAFATMVWDAFRDRVLLFGGIYNGQRLNDTWEWNGTAWRQLTPATVPSRRSHHAMAFDHTRQRIVMFGGFGGANLGDTWEWDGSNWIATAGGPSPRYSAAMASDPLGGVVLFGGSGRRVLRDTWVRRGTKWQQVYSLISPGADLDHELALDLATSRVLFVGGYYAPRTAWTWDGKKWAPAQGMSNRSVKLAYDVGRGRRVMVAFGGLNSRNAAVHTTSEWNGTSWTDVPLAPAARQYAAAGYDRVADRVVVHGGYGAAASTQFADTWNWDGQAWKVQPALGSFHRFSHTLAWDPVQRRLLMFGGHNGTGATATTYAWDRSQRGWTLLAPAQSPPARWGHAALSFSGRVKGVLIFGGRDSSRHRKDTWLWNGTSWSGFATTGTPSVREQARMALEPGGASVLLFGGLHNGTVYGDTWRLDLSTRTWTQLRPAVSPAPRSHHGMVFDAGRNRIVLVAGWSNNTALQDAWEWDTTATNWRRLAAPPFARFGHSMCEGPKNSLLVFGGRNPNVGIFDDTWTVTPFAAARSTTIGNGCAPTTGPAPTLVSTDLPYIGNTLGLELRNLPKQGSPTAFLLIDVALRRTPFVVCPKCTFYIDGLLMLNLRNLFGTAATQIRVPNDPTTVGLTIYTQGAVVNPAYPCLPGVGLGLSNALRLVVGAY